MHQHFSCSLIDSGLLTYERTICLYALQPVVEVVYQGPTLTAVLVPVTVDLMVTAVVGVMAGLLQDVA